MADIKSKDIKLVDIESIVENPKNANRHSIEQIQRLEKLIKFQGFRNPLIVSNRTGFLVVGHGRLTAAKNLDMKKVPVIFQDFENEAQEYAYLISDNEIARWAELDKHSVYTELGKLELEDVELLGIEDFELPDVEELDPQTDEDDTPELGKETVSKTGDVWILGKHRVMCGDSLMIDDVNKLMSGKQANMMHTDPPYGVDYEGVNNDHLKAEKLREFLYDAFVCAETVLAPGSNVYIWHPDVHAYEFIGAMRDAGFQQARPPTIQWVKDSLVLSQGDYHSRNEPCLYGWKPGPNRQRVEDRKQDTIWEYDKPKRAEGHPTMKPVALCQRAIENSSRQGDIVLDLFNGSGSTLIACENSKRINYSMELDPAYVDLTVKRWQDYTGNKAILESTNQTYEELKNERK